MMTEDKNPSGGGNLFQGSDFLFREEDDSVYDIVISTDGDRARDENEDKTPAEEPIIRFDMDKAAPEETDENPAAPAPEEDQPEVPVTPDAAEDSDVTDDRETEEKTEDAPAAIAAVVPEEKEENNGPDEPDEADEPAPEEPAEVAAAEPEKEPEKGPDEEPEAKPENEPEPAAKPEEIGDPRGALAEEPDLSFRPDDSRQEETLPEEDDVDFLDDNVEVFSSDEAKKQHEIEHGKGSESEKLEKLKRSNAKDGAEVFARNPEPIENNFGDISPDKKNLLLGIPHKMWTVLILLVYFVDAALMNFVVSNTCFPLSRRVLEFSGLASLKLESNEPAYVAGGYVAAFLLGGIVLFIIAKIALSLMREVGSGEDSHSLVLSATGILCVVFLLISLLTVLLSHQALFSYPVYRWVAPFLTYLATVIFLALSGNEKHKK